MKKSTRYSLIAIGFVVFFVLAPLIIFYVSGTTIDSGETNSTGILDAKTNPSGAQVFLDNQKRSETPAIERFLNQGEYEVTLRKDGYFDWTKHLPIEAGQVTYAQEGVSEVQLVKKSEPKILVPSGVTSFALVGDQIWFARGNSIVHAPAQDPAEQTALPLNFAPREVTQLRDKTHLALFGDKGSALLNTQTRAITPLPFSFSPGDGAVQNNVLLVNIGSILRAYDLTTGTETILRQDILAFTMLGSTAYFLDTSGTISTAVWDGVTIKDSRPVLSGLTLPNSNSQLIITDRKELFLKDGNKILYRVNQSLETVTSGVEIAHLDLHSNELTVRTASELGFYNFLTGRLQLLTRSTEPVTDLLIRSSIGWAMVANKTGLNLVEIDTRDRQNHYQLLSGPVWQLAITDNQKTILALQDGALALIDFRN
jgi:hypothetical protein